ncbi:TetR/AcrR family transcriptional regulator [Actinomycetospora callitridis]|uniref:TetR/AcrR family transcriptional regulator n=1 Tax=Actinomycetospora callitridis TaxID=913944 RepID=UPI00236653C0|nr:TetR/AcrR family transcriptional regulator [Actinomycetospora callitridis]MDD7921201.1 TetR/AcrR family transcriptional regulator [Actinomycetospora callitridis]
MPRTPDPAVRVALIEQAAAMLVAREPVTLRALAGRVGTSTMAVYTHFDGMPGLWGAVRQEGFARLARGLAEVSPSDDPVRDLAALGAAYAANAVENPALYRAMFDAAADLPDPGAAGAGFALLVDAAQRAVDAGRFVDADPAAVATRFWASGHGVLLLVLSGVLPDDALDEHSPALATAVFTAAGDDPERCAASVRAGWAGS